MDFADICIVSDVTIETGEGPAEAFRLPEVPGVAVVPSRAPGVKCARSWRYFDPVDGANPIIPTSPRATRRRCAS